MFGIKVTHQDFEKGTENSYVSDRIFKTWLRAFTAAETMSMVVNPSGSKPIAQYTAVVFNIEELSGVASDGDIRG